MSPGVSGAPEPRMYPRSRYFLVYYNIFSGLAFKKRFFWTVTSEPLLAYNFIINSSFQRLRDSCQLAISSNDTNRIGMYAKISLNIRSLKNTAMIGVSMLLRMDINQINPIHLTLNQRSKQYFLTITKLGLSHNYKTTRGLNFCILMKKKTFTKMIFWLCYCFVCLFVFV